MTTNKALNSRVVFEQIILEIFAQGCTYAVHKKNRALPGLIKVQIR